jgi:hypothetical protein
MLNRIRELRLAEPFRPFFLVLVDGRRLFVDERHHVGVAPDGSRLGVVTGERVTLLRPEELRDLDVCPPQFKRV